MIKVGIDQISLYTPRYSLDLKELAVARGFEPSKYASSLGQEAMSIAPPGEDCVTMAANAALPLLETIDPTTIAMVLFATESGIDQSKAAGVYVHELLRLSPNCRVLELKQACYAATGAIQLAMSFLRENPDKKILVLASDVARYGLHTSGESSQGAGAAAVLLSANPRLLVIEPEYGAVTESVMDFWRPNYRDCALVDGKYSSKLYLQLLEKTFKQYQEASKRHYHEHAAFCYHAPLPRLVEKAHQYLYKLSHGVALTEAEVQDATSKGLAYSREMGNSYTAALYVCLASLLEQSNTNFANKRIGLYSYGSGCVAEFFSVVVQEGYQTVLRTSAHNSLLQKRQALRYAEYEAFFSFAYAEDGSSQTIPPYDTGHFRLERMEQHKRIYAKTETKMTDHPRKTLDAKVVTMRAPGKLILSGEHAVVYGAPALALTIDRYVEATIAHEPDKASVQFHLSNFAHKSHLDWQSLGELKEKIKQKYHRFIRGEYTIKQVLQKPFELAQAALGLFSEILLNSDHSETGMCLQITSDLPVGCGLGSSAATILSVMKALSKFSHLNIADEQLFKLALEAELWQHGHSNGLDLRLALQGGCLYVDRDHIEVRPLPSIPFHLVQTGTPSLSTGQCVEAASSYFQRDKGLVGAFTTVTKAMDQALQANHWEDVRALVKQNHRLLTEVGVVPHKVQQFVQAVESLGGAAKICGAGAASGDAAGTLWLLHDEPQSLTSLIDEFQYSWLTVQGTSEGVHAA